MLNAEGFLAEMLADMEQGPGGIVLGDIIVPGPFTGKIPNHICPYCKIDFAKNPWAQDARYVCANCRHYSEVKDA